MIRKHTLHAELLIFPDKAALIGGGVELIADALSQALAQREKVFIAISGGSTPKPVYENLGRMQDLDWNRVYVCFVDERNVPPTHEESNFRMADLAWFSSGTLPSGHVLRMKGELDATSAAAMYETELRALDVPLRGGFPVFDLVLLGMGPDGHTASLFPGTSALAEREHWVVANWVPKLNTHRITLTLPVLNHARKAVFLVAGADKASALNEVLSESSALPASKVRPLHDPVWLLDEAAAGSLS